MRIDLNSDLGESYGSWDMGNDPAMLDIVSSANVACGFHAGSPARILQTLKDAAARGVCVGAHVGYPDLVGFGRRAMDVSRDDVRADTIYQIGALKGLAAAAGTTVRYVKPHGALYNTIVHHREQALGVIEAILAVDPSLRLMGLVNSPLLTLAQQHGVATIAEAFADRAYTPEGTLVPRKVEHSVLHDAAVIARRMLGLVTGGVLEAIDGSSIRIEAQSICVHGDNPAAVDIARQVRATLEKAGVVITAAC